MKTVVRIIPIAGLLLLATGCSTSTSPGAGNQTVMPKEGSYYIFSATETDSNGVTRDRGLDTVTVIGSGVTYAGKSHVVIFRRGPATNADIAYASYEPNGDISIFEGGSGSGARPGWLLVPVVSKGSSSYTSYDTTYVVNGNTIHDVEMYQVEYTGSEKLTKAGHTFTTAVLASSNSDGKGHSDYSETMWIAPEIGYMAQDLINVHSTKSQDHAELVGYVLK